jgi:deoxyribodipyrimidine photo-lyase
MFSPTRAAGLDRLAAFLPSAGRHYAARRNYDTGAGAKTGVSLLSPYVRHRLITEEEVVAAILEAHSPSDAEKFIQEVCWRTYWKGWLEMRPAVWQQYRADVATLQHSLHKDSHLAARVTAAETGTTGIACFDTWARELVETGYLHNHTRMWFASIWIYTLDLPWQLGADFFMRHLLDGDAASNTCSWRWVCGLHTAGKTYLARPDNIEKYTGGRFAPYGDLATVALPVIEEFVVPKGTKIGPAGQVAVGKKVLLVITEDDLSPQSFPIERSAVAAVAGLRTAHAYPGTSARVADFKIRALADGMARAQAAFKCPVAVHDAEGPGASAYGLVMAQAAAHAADSIAVLDCPVGPTADQCRPVFAALKSAGWPVTRLRRAWDDALWPHATHGFFRLKEKIPTVIERLSLGA